MSPICHTSVFPRDQEVLTPRLAYRSVVPYIQVRRVDRIKFIYIHVVSWFLLRRLCVGIPKLDAGTAVFLCLPAISENLPGDSVETESLPYYVVCY